MRAIASVVLLLAVSVAQGQAMYKCKTASGRTIYQQQPCAGSATEVERREIKADPAGDAQAGVSAQAAMMRGVAMTDIDYETSACMGSASRRVFGPMERRVANLEGEKQALLRQTQQANNNLAGASWESGLRSQIAGLDSAIATERAMADATFSRERSLCQEQGEARKREAQERFAAEDEAQRRAAQPNTLRRAD